MGVGAKLMRVGRPGSELPDALRAIIGRLRTDLVRFGAGRDMHGEVRTEGATVLVCLEGRDAIFVARQLSRRVHMPLRVTLDDSTRGHAVLRVSEADHE